MHLKGIIVFVSLVGIVQTASDFPQPTGKGGYHRYEAMNVYPKPGSEREHRYQLDPHNNKDGHKIPSNPHGYRRDYEPDTPNVNDGYAVNVNKHGYDKAYKPPNPYKIRVTFRKHGYKKGSEQNSYNGNNDHKSRMTVKKNLFQKGYDAQPPRKNDGYPKNEDDYEKGYEHKHYETRHGKRYHKGYEHHGYDDNKYDKRVDGYKNSAGQKKMTYEKHNYGKYNSYEDKEPYANKKHRPYYESDLYGKTDKVKPQKPKRYEPRHGIKSFENDKYPQKYEDENLHSENKHTPYYEQEKYPNIHEEHVEKDYKGLNQGTRGRQLRGYEAAYVRHKYYQQAPILGYGARVY